MSLKFDSQILGLTLVPFGTPPFLPPTKKTAENTTENSTENINHSDISYNTKNNNENNNTGMQKNGNENETAANKSELASKLQQSIRAPAIVSIISNVLIVG